MVILSAQSNRKITANLCHHRYTKSEQAPRFAFWYCGLGFGQIVGGLVSFAFQHVHNPAFASWRIMFVVLGCICVIVGLFVFVFVPDSPMTARFLSTTEKAAILEHVSVNRTGIVNRQFKLAQLWELSRDVQIWLLCIMLTLVSDHGSPRNGRRLC